MIKQQCRKVYSPGKNLSVDESLVLFKGKLSFIQYIKSKRARFGIKLFQLCISSGIPLDFLVYHGDLAPMLVEMGEGALMTERIPATLMERYLHKGHHLFIDNYYTSNILAKYFVERDTHVTGIIRDNRKNFLSELEAVQLGKRQAAFYQHEGNVIAKYRATKDSASNKPKIVNVLSTAHDASFGNTNRRDSRGGSKI